MSILENITGLGFDIGGIILSQMPRITRHFERSDYKSCFRDVMKISNAITNKVYMHYPKTALIVTITQIVFVFLFPSFWGLVRTIISSFALYNFQNHIYSAIQVHKDNNISEWSSSYLDKKRLEGIIMNRSSVEKVWEYAQSFFR